MKPVLVIALGNPLAGDDDVGAHVLQAVAGDAAVADVAELLHGGTDLLRLADRMRGRERIILIDAAIGTGRTPTMLVRRHPPTIPGERRAQAHDLDPVAALELLRRTDPELAAVECSWLLIEVPEVLLRDTLSPSVRSIVQDAAARLRALLFNSDTTA